jgi:DNA gyrase/topoisomerase IV subunit A
MSSGDEGSGSTSNRPPDHDRLRIVEALLRAQDNAVELVTIVGRCANDADAGAAVRERFGMSDDEANAALDMQVRRFTTSTRSRLETERENLAQGLGRDT